MTKPTDSVFSFEEVNEALEIMDGRLVWRTNTRRTKPGQPAGAIKKDGYWVVTLRRRGLLAHRVIWLLTYKAWPEGILDHVDGDRTNNAIQNLRLASSSENSANRKARSGASTPFKGVTFHKQTGRYQAQCKKRYIGLYETAESAARAYDAYASVIFADFAKLNFAEAR